VFDELSLHILHPSPYDSQVLDFTLLKLSFDVTALPDGMSSSVPASYGSLVDPRVMGLCYDVSIDLPSVEDSYIHGCWLMWT
jgi:hypothetical protein